MSRNTGDVVKVEVFDVKPDVYGQYNRFVCAYVPGYGLVESTMTENQCQLPLDYQGDAMAELYVAFNGRTLIQGIRK